MVWKRSCRRRCAKIEEKPDKEVQKEVMVAVGEKVKQMQPVWLCIFSGRPFEDTFENAQSRKVKQMQPMQLCVL